MIKVKEKEQIVKFYHYKKWFLPCTKNGMRQNTAYYNATLGVLMIFFFFEKDKIITRKHQE